MLAILINFDEDLNPDDFRYSIILRILQDLGIQDFNTFDSLDSYLDDAKFRSGYDLDKTHVLLDVTDFPYFMSNINLNSAHKNDITYLRTDRATSNIVIGTREFIKQYYDGVMKVVPMMIDSVRLDLSDITSVMEYNMYELVKSSDSNTERLTALSYLSKRSCDLKEDLSVINMINMISGYDKTDVLNILSALKESISITMLERMNEAEGFSVEDVIVEVPYLGLAYIQDDNILVNNLGKMTMDLQKEALTTDAENAMMRVISRAKVNMLHNNTVFPKKVTL